MAETEAGKKKVYVHGHTKEDGTKVKTHYRSTPNTSTGKKKQRLYYQDVPQGLQFLRLFILQYPTHSILAKTPISYQYALYVVPLE